MKGKQETFSGLLQSAGLRYDLRPVFDDLLTIMPCCYSHNPRTGKSYNEDLYMECVGRYPKEMVRELFPNLMALLILEMEARKDSSSGNDVLGEAYEEHFCRKNAGQFFTPWHACEMIAEMSLKGHIDSEKRVRVLDPTCGSGRMLLAGKRVLGWEHEYYGIDIDHTCVKMTAINLFLNGQFRGEVMCADALKPDDFRVSYRLSFLPFRIFRIDEKERSELWHMYNASFAANQHRTELILSSKDEPIGNGAQLQLF